MIRILKAAPGLDQANLLPALLGAEYDVLEYDPGRGLAEQGAGAVAFVLRDVPVSAAVMDAVPTLRLLQRLGHHVVGVDMEHAARKGIRVANIPAAVSGGDRMVAEHALYLMLALAKRARECEVHVRERRLARVVSHSLAGKTLGLVGLGNTGTEFARLAIGIGMRVIGVKRTADEELRRRAGLDSLETLAALPRLLAQSDFVSIHLPLEPATVGFFGAQEFAAMRRGAYLINIARGPIVDRQSLWAALESKHIGGAGMDVFWGEPADPDDPILTFPEVILTPHVAGNTSEVLETLARVAAENIRRVVAGQEPLHTLGTDGH